MTCWRRGWRLVGPGREIVTETTALIVRLLATYNVSVRAPRKEMDLTPIFDPYRYQTTATIITARAHCPRTRMTHQSTSNKLASLTPIRLYYAFALFNRIVRLSQILMMIVTGSNAVMYV